METLRQEAMKAMRILSDVVEKTSEKVIRLEDDNKKLEESRDNLKVNCDKLKGRNNELEGRNRVLEGRNRELEQENKKLMNDKQKLEKDKQELELKISKNNKPEIQNERPTRSTHTSPHRLFQARTFEISKEGTITKANTPPNHQSRTLQYRNLRDNSRENLITETTKQEFTCGRVAPVKNLTCTSDVQKKEHKLTWDKSTNDNATRFVVEVKSSPSAQSASNNEKWKYFGETFSEYFNLRNLKPGNTYYFRVITKKSSQRSDPVELEEPITIAEIKTVVSIMKPSNFEKAPKQQHEGRKSPRRSRLPVSPRKSAEKVGKPQQTVATKVRINDSRTNHVVETDTRQRHRATRTKQGDGYPVLTSSTLTMVRKRYGRSNPGSLDSLGSSDELSPRKTRESLPQNALPRAHSNESILDGVASTSRDLKRCSVDSRIKEMEGSRQRDGGLRRHALTRRNLPKSDDTLLTSQQQKRQQEEGRKTPPHGMGYYKRYFPEDY